VTGCWEARERELPGGETEWRPFLGRCDTGPDFGDRWLGGLVRRWRAEEESEFEDEVLWRDDRDS
jgi:hypothetical protein